MNNISRWSVEKVTVLADVVLTSPRPQGLACVYIALWTWSREEKKQLNQSVNLQFIFIYLVTQHHVI